MTLILVRKLLRDARPALIAVALILFLFATLWVKITQRLTAEITPFFNVVAKAARLDPVVLTLACVWAVGRGAGAVAGELDRGTMELLLSQPIPRNRLILAHFLVDCVMIPALCLSFWAGTEFGLWVVGPFEVDYSG